jgi:hypothetical protein
MRTTNSHSGDWRCRACDALLGRRHGDGVHVRYKDLSAVIFGRVEIECRRCAAPNTHETRRIAA